MIDELALSAIGATFVTAAITSACAAVLYSLGFRVTAAVVFAAGLSTLF